MVAVDTVIIEQRVGFKFPPGGRKAMAARMDAHQQAALHRMQKVLRRPRDMLWPERSGIKYGNRV